MSTLRWFDIKPVAAKTADEPKAAEIYVYGNIGDRWNEDGVVASELVREIAALDVERIDLRVNSYGGSVTDGMAILAALKRHKAAVHVHVDGVAISCASYIAMAGDTVTMAPHAQMMVHAPWGYAVGNAAELRDQADILDRYARAMAGAYAAKSGMGEDEALALLTDGKDHWYSAEEAVAAGLADEVGEEVAVAAALASSFDLARFKAQHTPAAAARTAPAAAPASVPLPEGVATLAAVNPPAAAGHPLEHSMPDPVNTAAPTAPFARTKEMNTQVLAIFKPFASQPAIQALQTEVLADPAVTVEQAQARLLTELGKDTTPANPAGAHPRVETVEDEADKQRSAIVAALRVRANVETDAKVRAEVSRGNPFRGQKLLDIARASLERGGVKTAGMSQMEVVAAAFTQGTSDFPVLLENAMHKTLQAAYARAPLTWNRFCRTGTVSDFRSHNRYRTGSFGALDAVTELGEFVNKSIPDGEKASIQADTKGNIINLSRKAIINDDLGAFVGLADSLGMAAARSVEIDVYALLALNNGLGPTQSDNQPLFHSNRANVNATGSALTTAGIDADAAVMAAQKDVSGNDYLDLRPAVLLVPRGLEGTARVVNGSEFDPDANNKLQRPNIVRGMFADIVGTPRLTGTRRYLFADPAVAPVLEVAFLDGQTDPFMEMKDGWDVDGASWKVRLDYGVAAVDFRGAVTNAGA